MPPATRTAFIYLFLLLAFLQINSYCVAQETALDPETSAAELSKKNNSGNEYLTKLEGILSKTDSARVFEFINAVEKSRSGKGDHFKARFNCLKASMISVKNAYYEFYQERKPVNLDSIKKQLMKLYEAALDIAYRTEDDYLVAFVSFDFASIIALYGETGLCIMYAKNSIDLYEKLSYDVLPNRYQFLAEYLYRVREYNECIKYAKKAVIAWQKSPNEFKTFTVSCINTVALGFHRQKLYDSAFVYYNQALQMARQIKDTVWTGIVSGNIGQVLYAQGRYDSAYTLLKFDFNESKGKGYYDNAANSIQWAARTHLAMGNKIAALAEVREAYGLLKLWPDANYLRNAYYTSTQIFREMGAYDSAFYYNNLYSVLNDSLEKLVASNSLAITKARLNDETSRYNIQKLNREKRAQLLFRNFIIAFIILAAFIALLYVNRLRIRHQHKQELALQEKNAAATLARDQLQLVTQNLIEKTGLVEELQRQLNNRTVSAEQQELASTISNLTILTEADWVKFKSLFEQLHPGFFMNLQEKINDITVAELRMAALTRLHLSTGNIASILGVSANSVYKTKQRLRNKLNIGPEHSIEDVIMKI